MTIFAPNMPLCGKNPIKNIYKPLNFNITQ